MSRCTGLALALPLGTSRRGSWLRRAVTLHVLRHNRPQDLGRKTSLWPHWKVCQPLEEKSQTTQVREFEFPWLCVPLISHPAANFQVPPEVCLVRHEHYFQIGSSMALDSVSNRTDFSQPQPWAPVSITQFTTICWKVNMPNLVSTLETNVSTGFTIAFLLPFRSFLKVFFYWHSRAYTTCTLRYSQSNSFMFIQFPNTWYSFWGLQFI